MAQARTGNLNRQHLGMGQALRGELRRRCFQGIPGRGRRAFHTANDAVRIGSLRTAQLLDRGLHPLLRMPPQQLQDPHVLPHTSPGPMSLFQPLAQLLKDRGKLPAAVNVRMIQRRRPPLERDQIMHGIEHLVVSLIAPGMRGHHGILQHDFHTIDVTFDRHTLKGTVPRHAVIHVVEAGELILVHLRRLTDAGIEALPGERGRLPLLLIKPHPDRLDLAAAGALPFLQAAFTKEGVEFLDVLDPGNRRGPLPLQRLHPVLDHRLLIPARRKAEQRLEDIMTRQRRVPRVELSAPTGEDRRSDGLGVVPPDLSGNTPEKLEGLCHPLQNRLGPLRRKSDRKGRVGIGPDQDQHIDLPPSLREVHLDLPEVRLDPLTRVMIQRNERLPLVLMMFEEETTDRRIAPLVAVLGLQSLEDPRHRVPLLRRSRLVRFEHLQDRLVKGAQPGSRLFPPLPVGLRFT
jgi:hypothetical protein